MSSRTAPSSNNDGQSAGGAAPRPIRPRVRLRRASAKRFGSIEALRGVDLDLWPGEVLGLVGDNAAGKSTLTKIIAGAYVPDAGTHLVDGEPVAFTTPAEARARRIEMVYQDLSLVRHGRCRRQPVSRPRAGRRIFGLPFLDKTRMRAEARAHAGGARHPYPESRRTRGAALRRAAAVDRDRPRRRLRAQRADHGRADLGAGRGRGRGRAAADPPVRPKRRRRDPDHPPAAGPVPASATGSP